MEVHFLNIEYLLLRAYDFFFSTPAVEAVREGATQPASLTLRSVATLTGEIALLGMVLTVLLIIFITWVRVRLVIVEHEGFEEKERRLQTEAHGEALPKVKNPQWERVQVLANSNEESDWRRAVIEADIMLGGLLESQGYRGEGIGEKLKDANPLQFTTLDLAWKAHKVRNDIAHGGERFTLSQRDTNATIDLYRQVFEEFDYI